MGTLTLAKPSPPVPQVCDNSKSYQIEYAKIQEEYKKIEYKKSSSKRSTIIKLIPNGNVGYNCVFYARQKLKGNLPRGLDTLSDKLSVAKGKKPEKGRAGVTAEGWRNKKGELVGHMVFIEEVREEKGTVIISEGNYKRGYITYREVPKSLIIGVY